MPGASCQILRNSVQCSRWLRASRMFRCQVLATTQHHFLSPGVQNVHNFHSHSVLNNSHKDVADDEKMTETLDKEEELLNKILDASLEEVLTHGWSLAAVKSAVTRLGYPPVTAGLVDSVEQLVLHHINSRGQLCGNGQVVPESHLKNSYFTST